MPLVGTVKDTVDVLLPLLEPKARTAHLDRMTAHYRRARSRLDKPQAIGAQATHPGRQVVALSGDGGLAMLLGELLTLHQMQLPVKIVVFNNGALSFVELEMKAAGIPPTPPIWSIRTSPGSRGRRAVRRAGREG